MGESVKAYIVLDNNADINDTDVINHCRKYLSEYKCPKSIQFIDFLPRNPSGKILRNELR
jgi:long-chain acyl-CoA synthetase